MAPGAAQALLQSPASFLGFEIVSAAGGRRRDRRVKPGDGTATLTPEALRFAGARLDQEVAIPVVDIHGVAVASTHNGRRCWAGKILKVSFGGGETRVLGLRMRSSDAAEWHRLLEQLVAG
ncbi:MAG: hypothetical protein WKF86_01330 [Acidimicrobiales bacterium]